MNEVQSNRILLRGSITTQPVISHKVYGEEFYEFDLEVARISGYQDLISVTISTRLLNGIQLREGDHVFLEGQIRTYNRFKDGKNRLMITVFATYFEIYEQTGQDENVVELEGYICREPFYRVSPLGREISDLMIAVNRMYGKSDYVPCIAWGRNAKYSRMLQVGQRIKIEGRLQSREYKKKNSEGELIPGLAREVSIHKIEAL